MLRLMSSAGMAATRSNLHSFSSSVAAPSFRALSRNFCSSEDKSGSFPYKKLKEWYIYEHAWFGPRWWMAFEFADIRKEYPKIPVKNVHIGMLLEDVQGTKLNHAISINAYSVIVKTDFKGQEVTERTILVMGRDVEELEPTAERINKFRSILTLPKDLIWNRKQQQ